MKLYEVSVKEKMKSIYFPEFLHYGIGFVWEKDNEHIWFKFIKQDTNNKTYLSGPHRYCWDDIDIKEFYEGKELDSLRPIE